MLALVVADRDEVGLVEQDVARHQHGIREERSRDELVRRGLLLELRHAAELPAARDRRGSHAASAWAVTWLWQKTVERSAPSPVAKRSAARSRVELRSSSGSYSTLERAQVDDAEEAVARLLGRRVLAEAAAPVAERLSARRLDAGEDPRFLDGFGLWWSILPK